ncbi:hypothetical protein BOTBODRAFT_559492 [Botryobasidium botryosum FD-172 SS1]|uniref:protein S-acyltransferase n=1 Tax=Botryobasidium botryosum (strain FD-172 SS1) TaxID=930990 RepID=A0A067MAP6_BOTB1|nr:hypothetical protein BOTBODRAFT_559492 [Botryobasidium botryosum FD-172 SS1]
MPPNCMASTVGSSYYPYGRSEGIAVVSQQSRAKGAPDTHEQDGCAATPSLDEVLAEVDPFLEVIGAREWRECAHHLVLTNIDRPAQDRIRVDALFTPGFVMESTTIRYPGKSSFREWRGKAYSDARFLSPELSPNIFKDRSVPALNTLVNLLLSSGMSIGGDFRDILVDSSVGQTLSLGNQVYGGAGTPLDAIIKGICIIERMIHEPTPKQVYDRGSLTIQLDYMFGVFEVLMNAGASCRPCGRDPGSATRGTLYLPCASPWQCGPSSHSGRVFSSLLSAGASLCPNLCELEEASRKHSAWKVQELLRLRVGDLENDLGDVLFQAVEWSAESAEEEEMQIEIIGHLVQAGARQEQEADIYRPRDVLTTAIVSGCGLRVVECLVGLGAKISPGTSVETQMCSVEVVEYLSRNATTANFRVWEMPTILHRLFPGSWCDEVDPNCLAKLRYLVEAGADVNAREEDGQTPLTAYLSNVAVPDVLVVQALLDAGADPNCNDSLYWSLSRGSLSPEVIRLLIQHGADVNKAVMVDQGQTPLHMLCRSDVADLHALSQVFEILIDSGANMNAKNNYGYTPLHAVCDYLWLKSGLINIPSVADLLVAAGTDLNAAGPYGETPLHLAVSRHRTANIVTIVDVLVTAGANVNAANNNGRTPLHLAAIQGNTLAIECLIAAGADVNILDPRGGGLLHYAACSPYAFPASFPSAYTWAANLDINARDYKGRSPLHWAARGPHNWENLEVMLKAGADINARDHRGCTPLHHAARLGTPRISKRLVSAGADVDALDQQGDTPLASAARAGAYKGIIQLLKAGVKAPDTIFEVNSTILPQCAS